MGEGGSSRSGETGEGSLSALNARRETPHPIEFISTCGAALSHKGRGHSNAHRRPSGRLFSSRQTSKPYR
ncbi:hypothetical protein CO683_12700 [Bradyrhizobium ottawaense]|uniref:Uncharacterized protein n=1 Tax=Bradyrhizobium ottawaense TaxID=931866 RepID=A0A2U8PB81_9BRAD|nr:hypothetical protein CIT37_24710 [Bradyrhizobium ottawaense]PDT69687.1 hypothetical protein CO683_12700 [Bradyrhizobium ottawaense]